MFRKAFLINFFSSSSATGIQFLVSVALSRLLTPSEIGIYSIAAVFVNIAHVFRDFGVSAYVQRAPEINRANIKPALGVLFSSTWGIAIIIYSMSGFISSYFGYPEIKNVVRVLSLSFLFIPFSSIMLALMLRDFRADVIARITFAGTTAYAITCLTLAYLGFGTISLAWANFANILTCGLAYLPFRPKWMPWIPSLRGCKEVLSFGFGSIISNSIRAANNALPDMLLGKIGSATEVGLLSRANSTVNIFTYISGSAVNFGSLSYISQAFHRQEPLTPLITKATSMLTGIGWPALVATFFFSEDIIKFLYGNAWLGSIPAIPALAIICAIDMMFNYTNTALTAVGKPMLSAIPVLTIALSRILFSWAFVPQNAPLFSWILCGATLLAVPPTFIMQKKYLNFTCKSMIRSIAPSLLISTITAITCFLMLNITPKEYSPLTRLLIFSAPVSVAWYAGIIITNHPLMIEIKSLIQQIYKALHTNR